MKKLSDTTIHRIKCTVLFLFFAVILILSRTVNNDGNMSRNIYGTFWALMPPVFAIIAAVFTKEIFSSLFFGIIMGSMLYSEFDIEKAVNTVFLGAETENGTVGGIIPRLSDNGNIALILFLVLLGIIVTLITASGGSDAYGRWAGKHIKTRRGALISTCFFGLFLFIDDYFCCLTAGNVMKPVTDNNKISPSKLAYILNSIAAPICLLVPVSSWAAAVSGIIDSENSLDIFIKSIPYNIFPFISILLAILSSVLELDFGPMKRHETDALHDSIEKINTIDYNNKHNNSNKRGSVSDLIIPVIVLFINCISGMLYTGGYFGGRSVIDAMSKSDAPYGLLLGAFATLVFILILYVPRGVLSFNKFMECFTSGFKAMAMPIIILTLAWTLGGMTSLLGADTFISGIVSKASPQLEGYMPVIIFLISIILSFSTGTSWGTFAILLPIIVPILESGYQDSLSASIAACLSGAVCGAQFSPISDITILASAGAKCNHLSHIATELPYSMISAIISIMGFFLCAFINNGFIILGISVSMLIVFLGVVKAKRKVK